MAALVEGMLSSISGCIFSKTPRSDTKPFSYTSTYWCLSQVHLKSQEKSGILSKGAALHFYGSCLQAFRRTLCMQHEQQLVAPLTQWVAQLLSTADYGTANARRNLRLTSSSQVKFVRKQILACLYPIQWSMWVYARAHTCAHKKKIQQTVTGTNYQ